MTLKYMYNPESGKVNKVFIYFNLGTNFKVKVKVIFINLFQRRGNEKNRVSQMTFLSGFRHKLARQML